MTICRALHIEEPMRISIQTISTEPYSQLFKVQHSICRAEKYYAYASKICELKSHVYYNSLVLFLNLVKSNPSSPHQISRIPKYPMITIILAHMMNDIS